MRRKVLRKFASRKSLSNMDILVSYLDTNIYRFSDFPVGHSDLTLQREVPSCLDHNCGLILYLIFEDDRVSNAFALFDFGYKLPRRGLVCRIFPKRTHRAWFMCICHYKRFANKRTRAQWFW